MNNQSLIIYENKILYEIFFEIKEFLKFELYFMSKKEILDINNKKIDNYIILAVKKIPNLENQLNLEKIPFKISQLVEKINIAFLKIIPYCMHGWLLGVVASKQLVPFA